jgi:nucleoside-diphosphate-sugar epimerase
MNPFVIIGGAGYIGIELVNKLLIQGCNNVVIVTRNTSKKILFRDTRVHFVKSIDDVKHRAFVINLAFANTSDYSKIKHSTSDLVKSIKRYHENVGAFFILHVSTIVLSELGMSYGQVSKKEAYTYSKSLQEYLFIKSFDKTELAIVRSGNVLSPNSPWLLKLCLKLTTNDPIKFKGKMAPSNATSLDFLVRIFLDLSLRKKSGYFNCCELSECTWDTFVDNLANLMGLNQICEFDEIISQPQSISSLFVRSLINFGVTLNSSPWHGDDLNRLMGFRWTPFSKDKIRLSSKFRLVSNTKVTMKMGREFKLFCNSRKVVSDFHIDYNLCDFNATLEKGVREMGF